MASCARGAAPDEGPDGGDPRSDGGRRGDAGARADAGPPDAGSPDTGPPCVLGTPDHCGECGRKCPGPDDEGGARTCSSAAPLPCGYECLGEHYDVDGEVENGCEREDAPVHDTHGTAAAITLPDVVRDPAQETNPRNVVGHLYSDGAAHREDPVERPRGRDDWYVITAVGTGNPDSTMSACLGIQSFPRDNEFEVCISEIGATHFIGDACARTYGGIGSACVRPISRSDAGGPYYVRVRKIAGSHSANGYALWLNH